MQWKKLFYFIIAVIIFAQCNSKLSKPSSMNHKFTNQLIHETSPYLLQHAHNPVNWHPWGEEALQKAKDENKLLIISIGYAACHWCHVMEHESFEDTTVAKIMNKYFVPIKVDREERPDVDDIYMSACNLVTGRGGWPLNAFALPDGKPVWAGTYFPKDQWLEILNQFRSLQENDPKRLEESAENITKGIQNMDDIAIISDASPFAKETLDFLGESMIKGVDMKEGGNDRVPKFPMPNNFEFLLKYYKVSQNEQALKAVKLTLDKMARGGIYDQLGGGFARYSTDGIWKAPHFEKMLYDNGQLISLYAKAYQLEQSPLYEATIRQSLDFIEREMTDESGGFYSSLDADSEGEEGKFYVWNSAEIDSLIDNQETQDVIKSYYQVEENGNWEHTNILHRKLSDQEFADKNDLTVDQLKTIVQEANQILFDSRAQRIRPALDDKILTSWNALQLKAYIDAYNALKIDEYKDKAIRNAHFIVEHQMQDDYRLNRNYKSGKSSINGFLDDYALTIQAFIALYQNTFDIDWLKKAEGLADYTLAHFFKASNSMFNFTSDIDPPLIARKSEINDNVIPSSNSMMARNLKYLGELLYNKRYLEISEQMLQNIVPTLAQENSPSFYSNWCQLYLDMVYPPYEIAIVGKDFESLKEGMLSQFTTNALFLGGDRENELQLLENKLQDGKTLIYVCQNKSCKFPVASVEAAMDLIDY